METRQSKKNDEAPPVEVPVVADMKDSNNTDIPVTTLDTILQAVRAIEAKFDERSDKIESTSVNHEEGLHSFSTRLDRLESQFVELQNDNN